MADKYPLVLNGTTVEEIQAADVIPVDAGGTGVSSLTANSVLLGDGTNPVQFIAPGAVGNVLTSDGTTWSSETATFTLAAVTDSTTPYTTSLGYQAGENISQVTNAYNTFIGYQAGQSNTTGRYNTCLGYQAGQSLTTGSYSVCLGYQAGKNVVTGNRVIAIGNLALTAATSGNNTAVGDMALFSCTTGTNNVALGPQGLLSVTTGSYNIGIGYGAGGFITTASNTVTIGFNANDSTGTNNTVIGFEALYSNSSGAGASNTALGYQAGNTNTSGNNNTFLGNGAVGASATASNVITLGNSSIATLRCQVTTITALSDARDKTDIAELGAGLDFINALAPVSFTWNMRDGGKVGEPDTGFIAQELVEVQDRLQQHIPGLVYDDNPDQLEAGYGKLIPVLVKAIQELSEKVKALEEANNG